MRKSLFNYSFYSHPEIGKFQGVTTCKLFLKWNRVWQHKPVRTKMKQHIKQQMKSEENAMGTLGECPLCCTDLATILWWNRSVAEDEKRWVMDKPILDFKPLLLPLQITQIFSTTKLVRQ
jgi:hypothetical protein